MCWHFRWFLMDFSVFYLGGSVLLCLAGSGSKKMREERTRGREAGSCWIQWGIQGTVLLGVKAKVRGQGRIGVHLMRYLDQSLCNKWSRSRTEVWDFGWSDEACSFWEAGASYAYPLSRVPPGASLWWAVPASRESEVHVEERRVVSGSVSLCKGLLFPLPLKFSLFRKKSLMGWLQRCHLIIFKILQRLPWRSSG